jgi:hypothetical protein
MIISLGLASVTYCRVNKVQTTIPCRRYSVAIQDKSAVICSVQSSKEHKNDGKMLSV